jgi:hypothetical protein
MEVAGAHYESTRRACQRNLGPAWDPFGSYGSHWGVLPYKRTLFFVLDEAAPKMATTATMDTKLFWNQWGLVVCIGGPWIPGTGWALDLVWTSFGPHSVETRRAHSGTWAVSL